MLCIGRRDWLRHPVAATLVALQWRQLRCYFYATFCVHLLFSVTLSLLVIFDQAHQVTLKTTPVMAPNTLVPEVLELAPTVVAVTTEDAHHSRGEWVLLALSLLLVIPVGVQAVVGLVAWAAASYSAISKGRRGWPALPGKELHNDSF